METDCETLCGTLSTISLVECSLSTTTKILTQDLDIPRLIYIDIIPDMPIVCLDKHDIGLCAYACHAGKQGTMLHRYNFKFDAHGVCRQLFRFEEENEYIMCNNAYAIGSLVTIAAFLKKQSAKDRAQWNNENSAA